MKTPFQAFDIQILSGLRTSARWLLSARLTAGVLLLASPLVNGEAAVGQPDFCLRTSLHVSVSCRAAAQSEYCLALAKCDNLADQDAREACRKQALADLKDAL